MFTNLFGKYLVEKNIITDDDFFMIKMEQNKTSAKLGLIAVSEKLITEEDADKINARQQVVDKKFGDIAIEMGLLTQYQVERLLALQGNPYLKFCQYVTDKGILELNQTEDALADFQKDNGFTGRDMDDMKSGDIDRILPLFLPQLPEGPVVDHLSVIFRSLIRLVSSDLSFKRGYVTDSYQTGNYAMQHLFGEYEATTVFSGDDQGILAVGEGFAKEFFDVVGVDALDSVSEFINIADGLFATSMSKRDIELSLEPPEYSTQGIEIKGSTVCVIPIEVNQQGLDLVVSL